MTTSDGPSRASNVLCLVIGVSVTVMVVAGLFWISLFEV